ncbi:kinase [Planctobacterium marinum]|uniref:Kinase n=1 Tax=Planctobacterium marinum TaxID=1631968 RepID=A0AA48HW11_9ALTE|nr:kinase [Planctobacterium marinum]
MLLQDVAVNRSSAINAEFLANFLKVHQLPEHFTETVSDFFLPLAERIKNKVQEKSGTFYLGINGCQGSGKSTLSDFLGEWLTAQGLSVAVLSLDDFYHNRQIRKSLSESVSPLLATRGVPGTHDTQLMQQTLTSLATSEKCALPRFNKAIDDPHPKSQWPIMKGPVDLVIVEGWCWGVTAQTPLQLRYPVNALEAEQDANLTWRNWVNQQLLENYQPLHQMMDFWVMLQAPSFDNVFQWRLEQEQKLSAKLKDEKQHRVMSEQQIKDFIQYYQRLTEECLRTLPQQSDIVLKLNAQRTIVEVRGL